MEYKAEKKELVSCFVGMEEDKALNYINGVRDQSLRSYLDKQYGVLDKERGEAANIDDAKAVISKEQNFLIKTASQLKSPLSNYGDIVQGDLIIIDKVAKNPSLVDKSLELADKIIDEKLLHETEVSEILLSSRDIEIVNDSLEKLYEKQKLYIQPEQLIEARAKAKAIDEALELINREQSLLSRMHNNIRHHSVDKELLYRCEIAKSYTKEEMHQKLILLVKDLIATKEVSERDILKDLQTTKDISATYKEFDIKLEAIEIKKAISNIFKEKNETKTIDDAISVIRKGEDYYSSLDGSIKYREQLDSAVTASIKAAKQNKQDNVIEALNKLSKFMQVSKGYQDQDHAHAVKALKSASNTKEAYNSLLKTYHDYFMKKIHIGLEHINEGKTLVFDKQKWTCPIKFIDHVMKNSNKQYAPMQELKIMRTNIIEREKHHEMGGPSL
ncbi:MAG UNVERIFIED_CONTAM: hypothetical protein LVQ98_08650 [Rickettsiaceae bacterium]